jgi:hypothetical protein
MTLDDITTQLMDEKSAQKIAVESLIKIAPRNEFEKFSSEVELKTDLTENEIISHSVLDILDIFTKSIEKFSSKSVMAEIVNKKERKLLSKDRKSRTEIVDVAKAPMFPAGEMEGMRQESAVRRFFKPRQRSL